MSKSQKQDEKSIIHCKRGFIYLCLAVIEFLRKVTILDKLMGVPNEICQGQVWVYIKMQNQTSGKLLLLKTEILNLVSVNITDLFSISLLDNIWFLEIPDDKSQKISRILHQDKKRRYL